MLHKLITCNMWYVFTRTSCMHVHTQSTVMQLPWSHTPPNLIWQLVIKDPYFRISSSSLWWSFTWFYIPLLWYSQMNILWYAITPCKHVIFVDLIMYLPIAMQLCHHYTGSLVMDEREWREENLFALVGYSTRIHYLMKRHVLQNSNKHEE